ncbi:thioester domain-containing protein [Nocardiopsis suaedae]|uniref:Thioester domain-containing protein n=1 Tax=Nocardiopsis suaedae TaxID=3018444 RepID=A0ABT4TI64_9ACTN|nr:thioester domain-containing protein [Nocardiopsis suaedae]MDA2804356.1 thioester domain-containing protein [Nocardiopsis suaedae]
MPRTPTAAPARPAAAAAALLGAAALACSGAPAAAASPDGPARVERAVTEGAQVHLESGDSVATALYSLRIDDSASVPAYGADLDGEVDHSAAYVESGFEALEAPEDAAGPVAWVVAHSYPSVGLEDLDAPGAGGLNESQAIAATQAAVWHFTDGAELAGPGGSGGNDPRVERFYRHLVSEAERAPDAPAAPTLALAPDRISGADPAAPLGPLRVSTTGTGPVRVAVNGAPGARLADADGETVSEVADGEEFYLHVPADPGAGVATVHARAGTAALSPGRAFSGRDGVATLPVVAADEALTGASAEVKADWSAPAPEGAPGAAPMPQASSHVPARERPEAPSSPAPPPSPAPAAPEGGAADTEASGGLALTGTWLGGLLAIGGGLAAAGAAALVAARLLKRRR